MLKKIATAAERLRRLIAFRLVLWAMRWARSSWGSCGQRYESSLTIGGRRLFVQVRHLDQPDRYSREELVRMLETVRKAEADQGWKCPDPGTPKRGAILYDGVREETWYWGEHPRIADGSTRRASRAREVVAVAADGSTRTLKSPRPGVMRIIEAAPE